MLQFFDFDKNRSIMKTIVVIVALFGAVVSVTGFRPEFEQDMINCLEKSGYPKELFIRTCRIPPYSWPENMDFMEIISCQLRVLNILSIDSRSGAVIVKPEKVANLVPDEYVGRVQQIVEKRRHHTTGWDGTEDINWAAGNILGFVTSAENEKFMPVVCRSLLHANTHFNCQPGCRHCEETCPA